MTTQPITSSEGLKEFYDDPQVVATYLEKRIAEPLGSVLHERQVAFLQQAITRLSVERVLDLAPGPARLSAELMLPGLAVALDASWNMLRAARHRTVARNARWQLAQAYLNIGNSEKAIEHSRAIGILGLEAAALAQAGRTEEAIEVIKRVDDSTPANRQRVARQADLATAFILMGDLDKAVKRLEQGFEDHEPFIRPVLRTHP